MTPVAGAGTPESVWQEWPGLRALPVLDVAPCRRAVVVAPHPDDETLAVGGLLAVLLALGAEVVLLALTDGEASHPGSTAAAPEELRARRTAETAAASRALGPGLLEQHRLHLPDGGLAGREDDVAHAVEALLCDGDWCVAPFADDGHPDHDAAGRAAALACATTRGRLLSYPLWAWHWTGPGDARLPWSRALRLDLPAAARARKQAALACYPSQTAPLGPAPEDAAVVPPAVLAHFQRPYEVLFT